MVRVASLNAQLDAGIAEFGPDRMSPSAQLVAIRREVKRLVEAAHQCLEKELRPALAEQGIHVVPYYELSSKQLQACKRYFAEIIFPVLTPLAFDPGRPFPHISNLSLNLAVLIRDVGGDERYRSSPPTSRIRTARLRLRLEMCGNGRPGSNASGVSTGKMISAK